MRRDMRQRKHAMAGLRTLGPSICYSPILVRVISSSKLALDAVMLEMRRMVAEGVMHGNRQDVSMDSLTTSSSEPLL